MDLKEGQTWKYKGATINLSYLTIKKIEDK